MAAYLSVVNSVLTKLREPTVSTVAQSPISLLVGAFINDAKREVEAAWQWTHLQDTFIGSFTTSNSGVYRWKDSICSSSGAAPNELATVWQNMNTDDYLVRLNDAGYESLLDLAQYGDRDLFVQIQQNANQAYKTTPYQFYLTNQISGVTAGASTKVINSFPPPDKTYNFSVVVKNPQADLALDADNMLIPSQPVVLRAYLYALYERGEELGEALTLTSNKADEALADAISEDTRTQGELQLQSE